MARTRPPERIDELVTAASRVFRRKGFRQALMADVAKEMGVSPGLLYTYVESKDALYHLVVERLATEGQGPEPDLPVPEPLPGETQRLLGKTLGAGLAVPSLDAALRRDVRDPAEAGRELRTIVREHYAGMFRWHELLGVLERTASDTPDLRERFYVRGRRPFVKRLADYLASRIESGALRPVPDPAVAARFIVETVAWFAYHRHGDFDSASIDDATAEETVVDLVVAAFVKGER